MRQVQELGKTIQERRESKAKRDKKTPNKPKMREPSASPRSEYAASSRVTQLQASKGQPSEQPPSPRQVLRQPQQQLSECHPGAVVGAAAVGAEGPRGGPPGGREVGFADQVGSPGGSVVPSSTAADLLCAADGGGAAAGHPPGLGGHASLACKNAAASSRTTSAGASPMLTAGSPGPVPASSVSASPSVAASRGIQAEATEDTEYEDPQYRPAPPMSLRSVRSALSSGSESR